MSSRDPATPHVSAAPYVSPGDDAGWEPAVPWDWTWEDYLYPTAETGGAEVLRNIPGLRDPEQLLRADRALSFVRHLELVDNPRLVPRSFDVAHWQGVHRQLFGDLYSWAGQFRSVDMAKFDGIDRYTPFVSSDELDVHAGELMRWVRDEAMFAGSTRNATVAGLTVFTGTANLIHPFREGNGRTLRVLSEHVAEHAGYRLDWSAISEDLEHAALVMTSRGQDRFLAEAFDAALSPAPHAATPSLSPAHRVSATSADAAPTSSPWQLTSAAMADRASAPAPAGQPATADLGVDLGTGVQAGIVTTPQAGVGYGD